MEIDRWLPQYQVSARYSILVRASPARTYQAVTGIDFSRVAAVRLLMRLRGYRLDRRTPEETPLAKEGRRFGSFVELATVPQQELVVGIAGRFWRPDGGIVKGLTAAEFSSFQREGYARAVWNFHLEPAAGGTELTTETRVQTYGRSATLKFRTYWLLVGPFSGFMRLAMLRQVKERAEQPDLGSDSLR